MLHATGEHSRVFYEIVPEQRSTGLWDRLGSRDKHVFKKTSAFSNSHDLFMAAKRKGYVRWTWKKEKTKLTLNIT